MNNKIIKPKNSIFIAFEGIDGSGKSTQAKILYDKLQLLQIKTHLTSEPTKSYLGSLIRKTLTEESTIKDPYEFALMFAADRFLHITNNNDGILKYLENKYIVITDRYYLSSLAYQSMSLPLNKVININQCNINACTPDLTIYIDIPVEIAFNRIKSRPTDIFEKINTLKEIKNNYYEAIKLFKNQDNIKIINGELDKSSISDAIWDVVSKIILNKKYL